jgi:hypothetical protein
MITLRCFGNYFPPSSVSIYCKNVIKSSHQCSWLTRYNLWGFHRFSASTHL